MKVRYWLLAQVLILVVLQVAWSAVPKVEFAEYKYQIDVLIDGKIFTSYLHTPNPSRPLAVAGTLQTKPVLYPVVSPSGVAVTRSYPFALVEGEAKDHPHHQGLYFTVDRVGSEENTFWGNSKEPLPAIRHVKVVKMQGGSGQGTLATISHWVGKDGKAVLEESREMVFRPLAKDRYAIDFTIYLKALERDVSFGDTKEGMFAVRVAQWLTEKETGRYLNAEGGEMEKGVWGKRSNWVRLQGEKDGKPIGVAILSHPSGVNSPTYWHARGYGCFSVNPLGQLDFQKSHKVADPKAFDLKLKAGERALFKYRVIVYEGDLGKDKAEALYQEFAK